MVDGVVFAGPAKSSLADIAQAVGSSTMASLVGGPAHPTRDNARGLCEGRDYDDVVSLLKAMKALLRALLGCPTGSVGRTLAAPIRC